MPTVRRISRYPLPLPGGGTLGGGGSGVGAPWVHGDEGLHLVREQHRYWKGSGYKAFYKSKVYGELLSLEEHMGREGGGLCSWS